MNGSVITVGRPETTEQEGVGLFCSLAQQHHMGFRGDLLFHTAAGSLSVKERSNDLVIAFSVIICVTMNTVLLVNILFYFVMCISVSLHACLVPLVCPVPAEARRHSIPWSWSYRQL